MSEDLHEDLRAAGGTGVALVWAERSRQRNDEGYDEAHDDEHDDGELARAAASYIARRGLAVGNRVPDGWPFLPGDWKPTGDAIRDLTKAGALVCAEIDRLLRGGQVRDPGLDAPTHVARLQERKAVDAMMRLQEFAAANPHMDTQGLEPDHWLALARAALDIPQPPEEDDDA